MSQHPLLIRPHHQMHNSFTVVVPAEGEGQRLDRWLSAVLTEHSRSEIQQWIKEGAVQIEGTKAKASLRLEQTQSITVLVPQKRETDLLAEDIPLKIVYEDDDCLVIDKPAGLVVHPSPGHETGTLVNAVLHHCPGLEGVGGVRRPGIVHRLDKETSGLIVVAKNDQAHRFLQAQFKDRSVYKEYLTLVEGHAKPAKGRISAPIGRHPVDRKRQAILPPDPHTGLSRGREAITEYYVQGYYSTPVLGNSSAVANFSLVQAILHTGRTHQIRVHFAWRKYPIVGDTVYGYRKQRLPLQRHFLHAHILRLHLPYQEEAVTFTSPLPSELQEILDQLT